MKKICMGIFVFILIVLVGQNVYSAMIVEEVCYANVYQFDDGDSIHTQWVCEYDLVDDGTGGGGNTGGGDDGNTGPGGGGGGNGGTDQTNGQQTADCWKDLTISDRVTSYFGVNREGSTCGFHTGVDIGTAQEATDGKITLYSGTSGTISSITYQANGAGFYIKVHNDNGSYTVYSHLDGDETTGVFNNTENLCVGDTVNVGDVLGLTDNSGNSSGSHLDVKIYFENNQALSYVRSHFGNNSITFEDIEYCSATNRTYIDPQVVLGGSGCN